MIASGIVYINKNGKIFVTNRRENAKTYGLPGGKLEGNESIIQGAIREAIEETGVAFKEEQLEVLFDYTIKDFAFRVFLCTSVIPELENDDHDTFSGNEKGIEGSFITWDDFILKTPFVECNTQIYINWVNRTKRTFDRIQQNAVGVSIMLQMINGINDPSCGIPGIGKNTTQEHTMLQLGSFVPDSIMAREPIYNDIYLDVHGIIFDRKGAVLDKKKREYARTILRSNGTHTFSGKVAICNAQS